jgi:hypothetical protein
MSDKVCFGCGKELNTTMYWRKWCSKECHKENYYRLSTLNPYWRLNKLCHFAKNRAKTKELAFNIDGEYMSKLWDEQKGKCSVSGIDLDLSKSDLYSANPYSPSIDRIIPSKGYIKGNVRIVCYQVNVALSEYGEDQLLKMCRAIASMPLRKESTYV